MGFGETTQYQCCASHPHAGRVHPWSSSTPSERDVHQPLGERVMRSIVKPVMFTGVSVSLAVASAKAQPATFTSQPYPFLGNTHVVADLNGDGAPDLVGTGGNSARIMLNNGNGTFAPIVQFPVGGPSQDAAADDFNGDRQVDLAVTINSPRISLSLLMGNGNG